MHGEKYNSQYGDRMGKKKGNTVGDRVMKVIIMYIKGVIL